MRMDMRICRPLSALLLMTAMAPLMFGKTITPSPFWKNQIVFPDEPFRVLGTSASDPDWVKFTILLEPYDPNTVCFQDSRKYMFHYHFATELLDPFVGMSPEQYNQVTLYEQGQQAILGAVIMPPSGGYPPKPVLPEYGIQFVRRDPYQREQIVEMFNAVKASIAAELGTQALYFPSYEQLATAQANRDWFKAQGIPISSTDRWAEGNACYSEGWALGKLKFFSGGQIQPAYLAGDLLPGDILLTDGVPAEVPFVAGIISLSPSTPNSHVAILAKTFGVPFVHLAVAEDANQAQRLVDHKVALRAFNEYGMRNVTLIDVEGVLDEATIAEILALKAPSPLDISPMAPYGAYSANTEGLLPPDIKYFGGKAANFGILRTALPDRSPVAAAISFDLWNEFLDQHLTPSDSVIIGPNSYLLFWADGEEHEGSTHTNFGLSKGGYEDVGLFDTDGTTLIDGIESFPPQSQDISYGRYPDGSDNWQSFSSPTPGRSNSGGLGGPQQGLFINEFMADNDGVIHDNFGDYDDCIELYNAGPTAVDLGGMFLTDDMGDPTRWMVPFGIIGNTLREEIANRLSKYTTYPPSDMAALSADLSAIRNIIKNTNVTSFTAAQKAAIVSTLQDAQYGFDITKKIRFRSSTNVEDSNQFTGAGLYESYSGCLPDDMDGDDAGPSVCDPNEGNERGVFRAIRKVFASFYNNNAFLERLRYGVNEAEVGMALLVHHSFPDEFELANGVAMVQKGYGSSWDVELVTQAGATPVTNPEDGAIPEEVRVDVGRYGTYPKLVRSSNLVPLGATVMVWQDDYIELSGLLVAAAEAFELATGKTSYVLDFEYKKLAPGGAALPAGGLVVKQIREIPQPEGTGSVTPFLISEPTEFCTFQGEFADVFANHRLKSRWRFETKSLWLNEHNLKETIYADVQLEYAAGGRIRSLTGTPAVWPFAWHSFDGTNTIDGWLMHHLQNVRTCELHTHQVPTQVSPADSLLWTLGDFDQWYVRWLSLRIKYAEPVPTLSWPGPTTTTDEIALCPCTQAGSGDLLQQRLFDDEPNGILISTSFYWPPPPSGVVAGYTAPLSRWVATVIEGYTSEPIVLDGYYSQTYRPEHHNFGEHFLFEPRLEPGISQNILDELRAQNIGLIHMVTTQVNEREWESIVTIYGFEDKPFYPADIDGDGDADFGDFAVFAEHWLDSLCDDCGGADLTGDGRVSPHDFGEFVEYWLAGLK